MRLHEFILREMDTIIAHWEAFAATQVPAATRMTRLELRDHAQQILIAISKDLQTFQSRDQQSEKSKGRAPVLAEAPETAAQTHAVLRARSGFDIRQLAAEYRALRASVLRLWLDAHGSEPSTLEDMIRFNEAIDQALAESIGHFSAQVEQARNLLLGMLGHDMRSPLQAIQMTASYLAAINAGDEVSRAAGILIRSGARMQALLDDLVDFNRTRLGLGIRVDPHEIDLAALFAEEIDQLRAAYPQGNLVLDAPAQVRGVWDGTRLQQVLSNLVSNALRYGASGESVRVALQDKADEIRFSVCNKGPRIEAADMTRLFEPLQRGDTETQSGAARDNLGLGLYIAREIVRAHGGDIQVRSDDGETVFEAVLPRQPPAP